ncbi:hypothetical protein N2152v2_002787 [Parachlorella kessleri]
MTSRGVVEADQNAEEGGWSYLLSFFLSQYGDKSSRESAKRVLIELSIFYLLILIGFGMLWLTWRSNQRLKEWKANMTQAIRLQRGKSFEPQDAAKLYGMF